MTTGQPTPGATGCAQMARRSDVAATVPTMVEQVHTDRIAPDRVLALSSGMEADLVRGLETGAGQASG